MGAVIVDADFETIHLMVVGNHLPSLQHMDAALAARIQIIPFAVTIPASHRDTQLPEKLLGEAGGILRWAIAGCLDWQDGGLKPPDAVLAPTRAYVGEADMVERWLEECCERDMEAVTASAALYASWTEWNGVRSAYAGSQKAFSQDLKLRGFAPKRIAGSGHMAFAGIRLRAT